MTRKDIYVFKAKFGVGNFEIEVYKLPVKKETAKAYFVDDHYTYRKKVLKEEIGITKELFQKSWLSILKKMISLKREAFLLLVTWRGWKILRRK